MALCQYVGDIVRSRPPDVRRGTLQRSAGHRRLPEKREYLKYEDARAERQN